MSPYPRKEVLMEEVVFEIVGHAVIYALKIVIFGGD
jgi:hypothetical protein